MAREAAQARASDRAAPAREPDHAAQLAGPGHARVAQLALDLNNAPASQRLAQASADLNSPTAQRAAPPPPPNRTGLPDRLKQGVETLSGVSLDHVRVHLNSSRPAKLDAAAYAQGGDIHLAPGQAHHLPHEAWHVAQQASGRVQPTRKIAGGVAINDNPALEAEADRMGALATTVQRKQTPHRLGPTPAHTAQLGGDKKKRLNKGPKPKRRRGKRGQTGPTPEAGLSLEQEMTAPEPDVTNYVMAEEGADATPYEEEYDTPHLFWRGDTRGPDAVFGTGFTTNNERAGQVEPGANRIIWRAGGGLDDILPASAVCMAKDIRGGAFFPLTGQAQFYLYAVCKTRVVNTFKAQTHVEARDTGSDDFQRAERYGYDPEYDAPDEASAVWQFQEYAAHRVETNEMVAAFRVNRRTLVPAPLVGTADVALAGVQFRLTFDSFAPTPRNSSKAHIKMMRALMDRAKQAAAPYEDFYPDGREFMSYMGMVQLRDPDDIPATLTEAPEKVRQTQPLVFQAKADPVLEAASRTPTSAPIQRVVVTPANVAGLANNLDTANLAASTTQIDALLASNSRVVMANLYQHIHAADQAENSANNKTLLALLNHYLHIRTADVAENAESGVWDKTKLKAKYAFSGDVAPGVQQGLRTWVTGNPAIGVTWQMIGKHLRNQLTPADYTALGALGAPPVAPGAAPPDPAAVARARLDAAAVNITGALNTLPDHVGASFRRCAALPGVYGTLINVGDYISDRAFWSTSALRQGGSAGPWGQDGTALAPIVYFIVNGTSGKFISKAADQEVGQNEVLFERNTTFQVTKIINVLGQTFFVYITQAVPPPGTAAHNPHTGGPA